MRFVFDFLAASFRRTDTDAAVVNRAARRRGLSLSFPVLLPAFFDGVDPKERVEFETLGGSEGRVVICTGMGLVAGRVLSEDF